MTNPWTATAPKSNVITIERYAVQRNTLLESIERGIEKVPFKNIFYIKKQSLTERTLEEDPIEEEPPLAWAGLFTWKGVIGKETYKYLAFTLLFIAPIFIAMGIPMLLMTIDGLYNTALEPVLVKPLWTIASITTVYILLVNTIKRFFGKKTV